MIDKTAADAATKAVEGFTGMTTAQMQEYVLLKVEPEAQEASEAMGMPIEMAREALVSREVMMVTLDCGFDLITNCLGFTPKNWEGKQLVSLIAAVADRTTSKGLERPCTLGGLKDLQVAMVALEDCQSLITRLYNDQIRELIKSGDITESEDPDTQTLIDAVTTARATADGGSLIDELLAQGGKPGMDKDGE